MGRMWLAVFGSWCLYMCGAYRQGTKGCGLSHLPVTSRIIGGAPAAASVFPWNVALKRILPGRRIGNHFCGGTLLSSEWVVTAAHCIVSGIAPSEIAVLLHENSTKYMVPETEFFSPDAVYYHTYNGMIPDIALLHIRQTAHSAPILSRVTPICLPLRETNFGGAFCVITGSGIQDDGSQPETLMYVPMPVMPPQYCANFFGHRTVLEGALCAGQVGKHRGACYGDSGGPLQCTFDRQEWFLAGVISRGDCHRPHKLPLLLTSVPALAQWIRHVVGGFYGSILL